MGEDAAQALLTALNAKTSTSYDNILGWLTTDSFRTIDNDMER